MAASKQIEAELSDGLSKTHGELIGLLDAAYTVRNAKLFNEGGRRIILDATSAIPTTHPRISKVLQEVEQVRRTVRDNISKFIRSMYDTHARLHRLGMPNLCKFSCQYHEWYEKAFRNYLATCGLWPPEDPLPCSLRAVLTRMATVEFDTLDVDKRWICEGVEGDVWKSKCCVRYRTTPARLNVLFRQRGQWLMMKVPKLCLDCALKGKSAVRFKDCSH